MELSSRMKEYRNVFEWTQDDLAKNSGVSLSTIKKYEAGSVENFTYENLKKISSAFKISPSEFLDEFLSVNVSDNQNKSVRQSSDNTAIRAPKSPVAPIKLNSSYKNNSSDQIHIIKISSNVGAGESVAIDGVEIYDTDVLVPFSQMLFKTRVSRPDRLRCMQVSGYSMVPMLFPDSWVIADVSARFDGDGLYIIEFGGNFMVKLLQRSPDGILEIISVNKDYKSYAIKSDNDASEVRIIGKVLRCVI